MKRLAFIIILIFQAFPVIAHSSSDFAKQSPYRSGNYGDSCGYADSHMRRQQGCVYRRAGYQMYTYCN